MTETYYRATKPDGTSFYDGTTAWRVGEVTHLTRTPEDLPYLSVSTVPTNCTGVAWPCRLFRVEPVGGHEVTTPEPVTLPNRRGATAWRVVGELPAHEVFGPNGEAVVAIIERAKTLTADEATRMKAAWSAARDAAWSAARDAARKATRDAARDAAWDAAWKAAWSAAWSAAWDAAWKAAWSAAWKAAWSAAWSATLAELVRDLISDEHYRTLMAPWWTGVGKPDNDDKKD